MIKIAVCDGDKNFADYIVSMLESISENSSIQMTINEFDMGMGMLESIWGGDRYEMIFMDILLPNCEGIDIAKEIRRVDREAILIFLSNQDAYMRAAFEVAPFRFVKKTISEWEFKYIFKCAYEKLMERDTYFTCIYNRGITKILVREILYFESELRTVRVFTNGRTRKFYGKLNEIEERLKNTGEIFIRIHQSYLVNFRHVEEIYACNLILSDGTKLSVSKERRKEADQVFTNLLRKDNIF